ncbi:Chitin binding domain containing protein-like protein [Leptotrombidium deliense]|uniref:Chitin binding domain containing protein-like protein n=1 Tax=Leptotrombidium deliense TaxID=299467 RepID=A0A443RXF3_9ACAR|nr:Chitin binding domain containing protein-like protein [Leptotrombidium deliense]
MDKRVTIIFFISILTVFPHLSDGHARMMEPPARNTMWRFGFNTTANYEDNQLFCGGIKVQWQDNKGKCGICGDAYDGPRIHETGGFMAKNITTRKYPPGTQIDVLIELIANHAGKFNFQICWRNSTNILETEECFEKVKLKNGSDTFNLSGKEPAGMFFVPIQLPANRTCDYCILRWDWKSGDFYF